MTQEFYDTSLPFQEPIRIRVQIDPGTPFSVTPEPQPHLAPEQPLHLPLLEQQHPHPLSEPNLQLHTQGRAASHSQLEQEPQPGPRDDTDSSTSFSSSSSSSPSSSSSSDSDSESPEEQSKDKEEPTDMQKPIFDGPFRIRAEVPYPIPNHPGYFYGPGGAAMYAGGQTQHWGPGGQELTPGKQQANAQLMMQGMGMGGNIGMGGMHLHVWQQPYWGWM